MEESFDELGEAIQLASQADSDAANEDDNWKTFEELLRQVQVQQRLILEGNVQIRKIRSLSEKEDIKDYQELVEKFQKASVKSEESVQLYMICQQGLEASQFSLALQSALTSAGNGDP